MIASSSTTTLASPAATTAVAAATRRATVARAVPRALAAAGSLGSRSRAAIAGASANRAVVVRLARGVRATRPLPSSSPRRAGRVAVAPRAAASNPFAADASGGVFSRPPRSVVESESVAKSIREPVENAIESLGLAVTVGDVAAAAGVKLSDAERAMTALAADTGAALEVSSEGDLLYVFDAGFRSKLASKSLRIRAEPALETAGKVGSYLARVTFGTTLVASIAIVYTAIAALLSNRDDRDRRDDRGGGGGGMFFGPRMYFSPFDVFWYFDPYYYERRAYNAAREGAKDMNFFEAVFSFVFGDGDPNKDFEAKRWALAGLAIQKSGGVVAADQLAPYLERDPNDPDDESFVLPALVRFNGAPEVDESSGEIVYRFESMEATGGGFDRVNAVLAEARKYGGFSTAMAEEEPYVFSLATQAQRAMAAGLGALNFVGVVVLGRLCVDPQIVAQKAQLVQAVSALLPGLSAYAVAFFAIPALRWAWCQRKNAGIEERNAARMDASKSLMRPGKLLAAKLEAAKRTRGRGGRRRVASGGDDNVFSSAKSASDFEADDFERRLRERTGEK